MRNPEKELREDQSLHFAQRFIKILQERLSNDPDFQRASAEAVLFPPRYLSELSVQDVTFERSNGVRFRVCVRREVDNDEMRVTRCSGNSEEGNFSEETVCIAILYDEEFEGVCRSWPGKRGMPNRGIVRYSRFHPKREPPFNTNELIAIREIGRFLRENFPAQQS